VAVRTGPHDAPDGDDEWDGEGHIAVDEGGGEDGGHDVTGRRGVMGQRGKEGDEGAGEDAEGEGGEAARPDAGAGVGVGQVLPPAARLSHRRCRLFMSCAMVPSFTVGNPCPAALRTPRKNRVLSPTSTVQSGDAMTTGCVRSSFIPTCDPTKPRSS